MPSQKPRQPSGQLKPRSRTIKATYERRVEESESSDFDADCQQAEVAIAALQRLFEREHELGSITVQRGSGLKHGKKWASFSVVLRNRDRPIPSDLALIAQQLWARSPETFAQ